MSVKRPRVGPIRNPTLFEIEKLEEAGKLANTPTVDRPFSLPGILFGTSAFTVNAGRVVSRLLKGEYRGSLLDSETQRTGDVLSA